MNADLEPDDRLVQYLLGRMPEKERVELEGRLLRDEDLDQRLLAATDDLIHSYLVDALSAEDRAQFEAFFLATSENRDQLAAMRDFLVAIDRVSAGGATPAAHADSPRSRSWLLAAAVLVAATVAVVWAARRTGGQGPRITAGRSPSASPASVTKSPDPAPVASATATVSPRAPSPAGPAVQVVRLAGPAGAPVRVDLSPETQVVRVEVAVDAESPSFDAVLLSGNGKSVWTARGRAAPATGEPLVLEVPATRFSSGPYRLRVEGEALREGTAPVLEYPLQAVRAVSASPR